MSVEKVKVKYEPIGPGAVEHNYLCAVCWDDSAVMHMDAGILLPCWKCQRKGWRLFRLNRLERWILKLRGQ